MGIVRFALRLPHTFYVLATLVLFLGVTAVLSMPTDIFPEIDIPVVTIIWQYTGLSTPEMEQRVTTYGQYALSSSVNGIRDIEAQTINGISVQKVFFQPDVNLDLAIAQIVSATNSIRGGANRRVLDRLARTGVIYDAWDDEPWILDGAAVRVSLICFANEVQAEVRLSGAPD